MARKLRDPYRSLTSKINYLANDVAGLHDRLKHLTSRLSDFKAEYNENWDLFNNSKKGKK